jgi:16S rRNA (cytosine1402-N4)-methyltransferase
VTDHGSHVPVMLARVVALFEPALRDRPAVLVDATVGLGGHAEALLGAHPRLRVVGLDRDPEALRRCGERLARYADRLTLVHAVFDDLPARLTALGLSEVNGVLFDLGVSSLQLDDPARGFAYSHEVRLDMRMDQSTGPTAADVVNGYPADRLARVLHEYGEERFARRIAAEVVRRRARAPLLSSTELVSAIRDAVPAAARRRGGNPAKRTFQALRMEINAELPTLQRALPAAIDALTVSGRIVALAYHSLEDRLVKQTLAARARPARLPGLPVPTPAERPTLRLLTRGGEQPTAAEVAANPRAGSARLRAAEKIAA